MEERLSNVQAKLKRRFEIMLRDKQIDVSTKKDLNGYTDQLTALLYLSYVNGVLDTESALTMEG